VSVDGAPQRAIDQKYPRQTRLVVNPPTVSLEIRTRGDDFLYFITSVGLVQGPVWLRRSYSQPHHGRKSLTPISNAEGAYFSKFAHFSKDGNYAALLSDDQLATFRFDADDPENYDTAGEYPLQPGSHKRLMATSDTMVAIVAADRVRRVLGWKHTHVAYAK
jgi:hypothetical protein